MYRVCCSGQHLLVEVTAPLKRRRSLKKFSSIAANQRQESLEHCSFQVSLNQKHLFLVEGASLCQQLILTTAVPLDKGGHVNAECHFCPSIYGRLVAASC